MRLMLNTSSPTGWLLLCCSLISCETNQNASVMDLHQNVDMNMPIVDGSSPETTAVTNDMGSDGQLDISIEETSMDMETTQPTRPPITAWAMPLLFGSEFTDQALGLDVLPDHRLVVAGRTEGQLNETSNATFADGFIALLTASGEIDWVTQVGSPAVDQFLDVVYHPQGMVIAGGFSTGDLPEQINSLFMDGLLVGLSPEGTVLWQNLINVGTINRLAVTDHGFIAVGAYEVNQGEGDYAAFVAKYNLDGEREWLHSLNSPSYDSATSVTVTQERIFVSGFTSGSIIESVENTHMDMFVTALSHQGERIWLKEYGSEGDDSPVRIDHDQESLIVAGYTSGLFGTEQYGGNDVAVLKINFEGDVIWQSQFGTEGSEAAYGLSISSDQNIYLSGRIDDASWDGQTNLAGDAFILEITSAGELVSTFQSDREGRDEVVDLIFDQDHLNLAGYIGSPSQSATDQSDIFVHRISATEGF